MVRGQSSTSVSGMRTFLYSLFFLLSYVYLVMGQGCCGTGNPVNDGSLNRPAYTPAAGVPTFQSNCCSNGTCSGCITRSVEPLIFRTLCRRRFHRVKRGIEMFELEWSPHDDASCNSDGLRNLIQRKQTGDPEATKKAIYDELTEITESQGHFGVVCSLHNFHFIVDSFRYCAVTNPSTRESCYVFEVSL